MALANTTDYALLVNKILWYMDNVMSGIDHNGFPISAGINREDFEAIMAAYFTYKKSRAAKPADSELFPNAHGDNTTTSSNG